jgi:hypothetical protein
LSPLKKIIAGFFKFIGFFELILGTVMAFFGAKFLKYTLGALTYIAVCGLVMILPYNFGFISLQSYSESQNNSAVIGWIAGTFIIGSILGLLAAYFLSKFFVKWGTTLLGSMTGIIVTFLLISPLVNN